MYTMQSNLEKYIFCMRFVLLHTHSVSTQSRINNIELKDHSHQFWQFPMTSRIVLKFVPASRQIWFGFSTAQNNNRYPNKTILQFQWSTINIIWAIGIPAIWAFIEDCLSFISRPQLPCVIFHSVIATLWTVIIHLSPQQYQNMHAHRVHCEHIICCSWIALSLCLVDAAPLLLNGPAALWIHLPFSFPSQEAPDYIASCSPAGWIKASRFLAGLN